MATRRELEELDRKEARERPEDRVWTDPTVTEELEDTIRGLEDSFWLGPGRESWEDKEPDFGGVLTADRIRAYHYQVGRMIRPFQEEHLNPASYDLTLGPRCLVEGHERILSNRGPVLEIPPNSIVFVSSREMLLMPHWLVARFNLKSELLFAGLLMGAGPQIDPGFMGLLSCPLHNISSEAVRLKLCQAFAKVDFVRTTWTVRDLETVKSEEELHAMASQGRLEAKSTGEKVSSGAQGQLWGADLLLR